MAVAPETSSSRRSALRLGLLVLSLVGMYLLASSQGWTDGLSVETIRARVDAAGAWGPLLFVGLHVVAVMLYVPGFIPALAGILAFGPLLGGLLSLIGGCLGVNVAFLLTRAVGGQSLDQVDNRWVRRALDQLDSHPIRAVVLVRLVFWMAAPGIIALALSPVRLRDHVVGSVIGLIPAMVGLALVGEWAFAQLSP